MKYIPRALLRRRRKPFLIWAAPPFLVCHALVTTAFAFLVAIESGSGSIIVADEAISQPGALLLVVPLLVADAALVLALAHGLLEERTWARPLACLGLPISHVVTLFALAGSRLWILVTDSVPVLVMMSACAWYFYRYAPVRDYYRRLAS
ncbi:MAG TPA: hypothetical protein VK912_00610 [Longimicrobiales bacterium]|nr:hypothetical protein [Longimicrobiales bacterium]